MSSFTINETDLRQHHYVRNKPHIHMINNQMQNITQLLHKIIKKDINQETICRQQAVSKGHSWQPCRIPSYQYIVPCLQMSQIHLRRDPPTHHSPMHSNLL